MKRLLFFITALIISQISRAQVPTSAVILPTGQVEAWYPFCHGDTTDHGTIGIDLINHNLRDTMDRFGDSLGAHYFNGLNSEMHYTTFFSMAAGYAYSVHFRPTALQSSVILYNGDYASTGMGLVMTNATGTGPGNHVALAVAGVGFPAISATPLALNQWHHVVLSRNGNAYVVYIDQVQDTFWIPAVPPGFIDPATTPPAVQKTFQLGARLGATPAANSMFFQGELDDIAIYSRLITFPTEVNRLFNYNPDIIVHLGKDTSFCADYLKIPLNDSLAIKYPSTRYFWQYDTLVGSLVTSVDTSIAGVFSSMFYVDTPSISGTKIALTITRPITALPYGTTFRNAGTACIGRDTITLYHKVVSVNLGNDTTFCKGDTLTLRTNPATAPENYLWHNVNYDTTGILVLSTDDTFKVERSGIYVVKVDSSFTDPIAGPVTCYGTDTIRVTVPTRIEVHLGGNDTLCTGGVDILYSLDSASYGSPVYIWGGPPNVGGSTTPVVTATVTGTYWLQVTDSTCVASDTMQALIVYDTVHVYNNDTGICIGEHIVTIASFDPSLIYQWTPTSGIPSSTNPATTITPDTSAWYILTARSVVDGHLLNCVARDSFYLDVQPIPFVYAGGNRSVCEHDTIRITPTIEPNWYTHYSYNWTPGTNLDDSTSATVIFSPGDTTNLVLIVTTPAGCTGKDSAMIYTHSSDFATMDSNLILCPTQSVQLTPLSTEVGTTTYVWHPGTYLDDSTSATPIIHPIVSTDYIAVAKSVYGCRDTLKLKVIVNPAAVISLEDSVVIYPGDAYHMSPGTNASYFSWTPPLGLNDTSISNPIATPAVSTKYILTATTELGCKAVDSINVRLDEGALLAMPNAFVPGSEYNGTFKVILKGLAKLKYFRIYNRWGNMVFESTDIAKGWDGTFNGKPEPVGVYIYDVQAVTDKGFVYKKQGNVTLLK